MIPSFPGNGRTLSQAFGRKNERHDADFGRWNGAMFESGMHRAGALVAPARCAPRMLQPLWRAAAQRAAAAATAVPDARADHAELPSAGARAVGCCGSGPRRAGTAAEVNADE